MQFVQRRLNSAFRFGIQCGRRFIQNQDWAVTQQRARNRNTLTLTTGQEHAIFTNDGIQTVIHLVDKVHRIGHACGILDLLAAVLFSARISDVVGDRIVKQMHVLRNQRNLVTQRLQGVLPQVVTVQENFTFVDVVETGDEAGNGGFTGARTAYQRHRFTRRNRQVDIAQSGRIAARIGEGHIVEFNIATGALNLACTFVFFLLGIQNAEQCLTSRHPTLELGVDVCQ